MRIEARQSRKFSEGCNPLTTFVSTHCQQHARQISTTIRTDRLEFLERLTTRATKPNRLARRRSELALALGVAGFAKRTANWTRPPIDRDELVALHAPRWRDAVRLQLLLRRRPNPVRRPRRGIDYRNFHRPQPVFGERVTNIALDLSHRGTTGVRRRDGYFDACLRHRDVAHNAELDDAHRRHFGILYPIQDREQLVAARDGARYHDAPGCDRARICISLSI